MKRIQAATEKIQQVHPSAKVGFRMDTEIGPDTVRLLCRVVLDGELFQCFFAERVDEAPSLDLAIKKVTDEMLRALPQGIGEDRA